MSDTIVAASVVLELSVTNHPGVMSHVSGLFSRRAFNVEAILCLPVGDRTTSRVWLLVADDVRLEQMERQLEKLQDVREVRRRDGLAATFLGLADALG